MDYLQLVKKIKDTCGFGLLLIIILIIHACGSSSGGQAGVGEEQELTDFYISQLTLEEKVNLMGGGALDGSDPSDMFTTLGNERLNIPGLIFADGPRGVRRHIFGDTSTTFPVPMARAATWDLDLEERVGEVMGIETRASGYHCLLAPAINQVTHPRHGRAQETYGEDTCLLGKFGAAFVKGVQKNPAEGYTVMACVKHFAANNIENTRFYVDVNLDERTLREVYLPHFKWVIDEAEVGSLMGAYNKVNGHYSCENKKLLTEILKEEWGFEGFVLSDWFGNKSTVASALAGLDIEMPTSEGFGNWAGYWGATLVTAVENNEVSEDHIDNAVRRILSKQIEFGFFDNPVTTDESKIETPESIKVAKEAARKGTVLLKNNSILPLDRDSISNIVVVGEFADSSRLGDMASSNCLPSYSITPYQGIKNKAGSNITVSAFSAVTGHETEVSNADIVVVVCAYAHNEEGEGLVAQDRVSMALPADELQVLNDAAALNSNIIVVLESGGAITMSDWLDKAKGIIMAWYPGMEGGTVLGELIFGEVNFSGKLPQSFPVSENDLPAFDNTSATVTYNYYHGYRHLDKNGTEALFPFGYGLSYTTYSYSNLTIAESTVTKNTALMVNVDVENTGVMNGEEIVQLYVGYSNTGISDSIGRPVKELKAFDRVSLAAGEKKTVTLTVNVQDLSYYNAAAGQWEIETMAYEIYVGPSSKASDMLSGTFTVTN